MYVYIYVYIYIMKLRESLYALQKSFKTPFTKNLQWGWGHGCVWYYG